MKHGVEALIDHIATLEDRIATLEAALQEIAEHGPYTVKNDGAYHVEVSTEDLKAIARRALNEETT